MRRILNRRPSPALVISGIALFLAMSGVSYGLATGVIDSREIKNNTIMSRDVRNGKLIGKDFGRNRVGGGAIKESTLGNVPSAEGLAHHAVVSGSGQLVRGRGASSAARTAVGRYQVLFDRDVRGCAYAATVGDTSAANPPGGEISVASLASNVAGVTVRTENSNGSPTNKPFHLLVSC